jgi:hypothetical protein
MNGACLGSRNIQTPKAAQRRRADEQTSAMAKRLEMPYGVRVIQRVQGFLLHLLLEQIFVDFSNFLNSIFSS